MTRSRDLQGALDAVTFEMDAVRYVLCDLAALGSDPDFSPWAVNRLYNRYNARYEHLHARRQSLTGLRGSPVRVRVLAGGDSNNTGPSGA